jgi:hypothetical protein
MMRHRASSKTDNNFDQSSDEDDAFTALSRKRKGEAKSKDSALKKLTTKDKTESEDSSVNQKAQIENQIISQAPVVIAQTSSTKRHHGEVSDVRKAKLDAILLELEADTSKVASATPAHVHHRRGGNTHQRNIADSEQYHRTGGSFVDPGDELITTNIFVGNLAPSITEEQMTELFRQFGETYFDLICHSLLR